MAAPDEVESHLREWILTLLEAHRPLLSIAVRQRAKFEGWLKFELAAMALKRGAQRVEVEAFWREPGSGAAHFSDIAFTLNGLRYDLEIKTANTNDRVVGVKPKTRPVTKNIAGIIADVRKLRSCPGQGVMAFVLFPVRLNDSKWHHYLKRIRDEAGVSLSPEKHCASLALNLTEEATAALIVCAFSVPKPSYD